MRVPATIRKNRAISNFLHVVFPTAAFLLIGSMFWIGFSSGTEPLGESAANTGGAENLTYSAELPDGSSLDMYAQSAVLLSRRVNANNVRGSVTYPDGHIRTVFLERVSSDWNLQRAFYWNALLSENADDGSEIQITLETGTATENGIMGSGMAATIQRADNSTQTYSAARADIPLTEGVAKFTDGATFTWTDGPNNDWLKAETLEFHVEPRQSWAKSLGEVRFEFYGGHGRAGQLNILGQTGQDLNDSGQIHFTEGVQLSFP